VSKIYDPAVDLTKAVPLELGVDPELAETVKDVDNAHPAFKAYWPKKLLAAECERLWLENQALYKHLMALEPFLCAIIERTGGEATCTEDEIVRARHISFKPDTEAKTVTCTCTTPPAEVSSVEPTQGESDDTTQA
jgi:hypothetical protein